MADRRAENGQSGAQAHASAATTPRVVAVRLLDQFVESRRHGVYYAIAPTTHASLWWLLDGTISALSERERTASADDLQVLVDDVVRRSLRLLRRQGGDPSASATFAALADELRRRREAWAMLASPEDLMHRLYHGFLWNSAWHLLAAGVGVRRIVGCFEGASKTQPVASWTIPSSAVVTDRIPEQARDCGYRAGRAVQRVRKIITEKPVQATPTRVAPEPAPREAAPVRSADPPPRPVAEAVRERAPAAQAALWMPQAKLDGAKLHTSVFSTWLGLVCFSWISLIWGGIITAPFGVGIGVLASVGAGIFAVPLWGTVFGFLGMAPAMQSTLKQMGFREVEPDHRLRSQADRFAAELAIPTPSIGLVAAENAFAMGVDRNQAAIAIGEPLLDKLTEDEVAAVLGHEFGHVVSGDMRRMMLMRTFQNASVWFMFSQGFKLFARWIICWAAELMILSFSRNREYWADAIGAALTSKEAMIGALQKLDGIEMTDAEKAHARFMFHTTFSTHPTIAERVEALERETYIQRLPRQ